MFVCFTIAITVGTLSHNVPITVFFHKRAITLSISIVTFKAFTILILFDSLTILYTVLKHRLEFRAISHVPDTFAFWFAIFEFSLHHVTGFGSQLTVTVGGIRPPLSCIGITISPYHSSLSMLSQQGRR